MELTETFNQAVHFTAEEKFRIQCEALKEASAKGWERWEKTAIFCPQPMHPMEHCLQDYLL